MCWYGTVISSSLFWGEIVDADLLNATFFIVETGEEMRATKFIIAQYLFGKHFYLVSNPFVLSSWNFFHHDISSPR